MTRREEERKGSGHAPAPDANSAADATAGPSSSPFSPRSRREGAPKFSTPSPAPAPPPSPFCPPSI